MNARSAVSKINKENALLVFPIKNHREPDSLWRQFRPRKKMVWEWDGNADGDVAKLWMLRENLSRSGLVVYCKWYQGRATLFSNGLYTAILRQFQEHDHFTGTLSFAARDILEQLLEDSPISSKQLKKAVELTGRLNEPTFQRALKELYNRFLIVGYGEVDEGAFPSLAIGASSILFDHLILEAKKLSLAQATSTIAKDLAPPFKKFYDRNWQQLLR